VFFDLVLAAVCFSVCMRRRAASPPASPTKPASPALAKSVEISISQDAQVELEWSEDSKVHYVFPLGESEHEAAPARQPKIRSEKFVEAFAQPIETGSSKQEVGAGEQPSSFEEDANAFLQSIAPTFSEIGDVKPTEQPVAPPSSPEPVAPPSCPEPVAPPSSPEADFKAAEKTSLPSTSENQLKAQIDAIVQARQQAKANTELQNRVIAIQESPSAASDSDLKSQINTIVSTRKESIMESPPAKCGSDLQSKINKILSARKEHVMELPPAIIESPPAVSSDDLTKATINAIVSARKEHCMESPPAKSSESDDLKTKINAIVSARKEHVMESPPPKSSSPDLKTKINAIVSARKERCMESPPAASPINSNDELQEKINSIVKERKSCQMSPVPGSSPVPVSSPSGCELQDQINGIVNMHAKSLKSQKSVCGPSPSPAKALSDFDLSYYANIAVSQAKARSTPAKDTDSTNWGVWEDDAAPEVAPCQLHFGDDDVVEAAQGDSPIIATEAELSVTEVKEVKKEPKIEARPFDVRDIPSPTRNRAKRQQLELFKAEQAAVQDASEVAYVDVQQTTAQGDADITLEKYAEQSGLKKDEEVTAPKAADDEEAAAQLKEKQEKWARMDREKAALREMDKLCIDAFLQSVKQCASREKVRTPIKGSNLYTKHMRPNRPPGTSVKMAHSSFMNLSGFLQFLEAEGLLRLRPGLTDPMVSEINFEACRKWKYDPQSQDAFLSVIQEAPHEAGCSCRLCLPCAYGLGRHQ